MPIPNDIKKQVREQILKNLDTYFKSAEDVEDLHLLTNTDVADRTADFYLAMYNLYVQG